jgi:hypothetical protein
MTPADAAKLLDIPADATPEQLEARFNELRAKLEDKIAKAPTPGLKAKYRESLDEITSAFETLILAADSSTLPVTQKSGAPVAGVADAGRTRSPSPIPGSATPVPAKRAKSGGKEFVIVAVVAVVLLGAGGWFVMKTRAENAEAARVAAEAKAEGERQAAAAQVEKDRLDQAARFEAEEKKKAEENERIRLEKLTAQLRADLAETKVAWEAFEREERAAERRLAELKSDLRSMRDAPAGRMAEAQAAASAQQDYYQWLSDTLARHPAKVARGRAEELLSARQPDEAKAAIAELTTQLRALESEIPRQRTALLDLDGEIILQTNPEATWTLTDAFGQVHRGQGPAQLKDVAVGTARLAITADPWGERRSTTVISRSKAVTLDAMFRGAPLQLTSEPAGATVMDQDGRTLGVTPLTVPNLPPTTHRYTLSKADFHPAKLEVSMTSEAATRTVKLRAHGSGLSLPAKWRYPARLRVEKVTASTGSGLAWSNNSIEEWIFSAPDAEGDWTQIERTIISDQSVGLPATVHSGSVIRFQRKADGNWESQFTKGGVTDPAYANVYRVFNFTPAMWGLQKFWPPDSVVVEGTWPIQVTDVPGFGTLTNTAGTASGKLLAIDRRENADWATIEISYDVKWATTAESKIRMVGNQRFRVNLSEGYIDEYHSRLDSSGSVITTTLKLTKR